MPLFCKTILRLPPLFPPFCRGAGRPRHAVAEAGYGGKTGGTSVWIPKRCGRTAVGTETKLPAAVFFFISVDMGAYLCYNTISILIQKGIYYMETVMTDARALKSNVRRTAIGFLLFMIVPAIAALAIMSAVEIYYPAFADSDLYVWVCNTAPLYLVGLPLLALFLVSTDKVRPVEKKRLGFARLFLLFAVCGAIGYLGSLAGQGINTLLGRFPFFSDSDALAFLDGGHVNVLYAFLFTVVIAPVMEELVFRKALISRVRAAGEVNAVVLSALVFGLAHGNLSQFIYAFLLGLVFGFVFARTGRVIYSMLLHMFFNFFFGFLPVLLASDYALVEAVSKLPPEEVVVTKEYGLASLHVENYGIATLVIVAIGVVVFVLIAKELFSAPKPVENFTRRQCRRAVWGNIGTWLVILAGVATIAISMLDPAYIKGMLAAVMLH